jgi:hypothetical protein
VKKIKTNPKSNPKGALGTNPKNTSRNSKGLKKP